MIGFLRGKVAFIDPDCCLMDVGGVGYTVYVPDSTREKLREGEEALIFTHLLVREDALTLFGFYSREEYRAFQLLISVSGIGPKVALGVLSSISAEEFYRAIHLKDAAVLKRLPGIGKKTAERLLLELKDKIGAGFSDAYEGGEAAPQSGTILDEAAAALAALGYTSSETAPVLRRAKGLDSVEEAVKFALREFAKKS